MADCHPRQAPAPRSRLEKPRPLVAWPCLTVLKRSSSFKYVPAVRSGRCAGEGERSGTASLRAVTPGPAAVSRSPGAVSLASHPGLRPCRVPAARGRERKSSDPDGLGDADHLRDPGRQRLVRDQRDHQLGDRAAWVSRSPTVATRTRWRPTPSVRPSPATSTWTDTEITQSVTIKRDATPPTVTVVPARAPDANGWYNHAVTVGFSGADATSGIDVCSQATYAGPDNANASVAALPRPGRKQTACELSRSSTTRRRRLSAR